MPPHSRRKRSGEYLIDDLAARIRGPRTLSDFERLFVDDANCRLYLAALRWPHGFVCPHCEASTQAHTTSRGLLRCTTCGLVCTPTTGTSLERSSLPLTLWLRALWELTASASGADMAQLQAALPALRRHQIVRWLASLQHDFDKIWETPLSGVIEVARVPVELGVKRDARAETAHSVIIAIAVEVDGDGLGGARVAALRVVDRVSMTTFIQAAVAPGSCIRTSRWGGYARIGHQGYHRIVARGRHGEDAMRLAQRVAAVLGSWLAGIRGLELEHLDYHLSEFNFRYAAQLAFGAPDRAKLFNAVLRLALAAPSMTQLVGRSSG